MTAGWLPFGAFARVGEWTVPTCQEEDAVITDKNVLVVDDDPCIVELLSAMLSLEGYAVRTATSAGQAMQLARGLAPDIVLVDWMMPEMDGMDLCRMLKKHTETASVPVIVISANDRVRTASREAGADAWLLKPFDLDDLLACVRRSLATRVTTH